MSSRLPLTSTQPFTSQSSLDSFAENMELAHMPGNNINVTDLQNNIDELAQNDILLVHHEIVLNHAQFHLENASRIRSLPIKAIFSSESPEVDDDNNGASHNLHDIDIYCSLARQDTRSANDEFCEYLNNANGCINGYSKSTDSVTEQSVSLNGKQIAVGYKDDTIDYEQLSFQ